MKLELVITPNPLLKQKSVDVDLESELREVKKTLKQMSKLMYSSDGCGIAAPQVGINKRFIVVDCTDKDTKAPKYLINPVITKVSGDFKVDHEGCLSVPGIYIPVSRQEDCTVEYYDLDGNKVVYDAEGFEGRCIQHEVDHLDGIVMLDRLSVPKRIEALKKYEEALSSGAKPGECKFVID